ncbi:MAG: hypothetical protein ACLFVP_06070 [Candidatus Bathyarchaeia archaeon]
MSEDMDNLTPEEEELLMKLNNHDVEEISFSVTSDGITYEDIEELTGDYNPIIFRRLLRSLADKGYLEEKEHGMFVFCPKCNSLDVHTKYTCTKCKSMDISRNDFIEHPHCGYIDEKSKFERELRYVCPNCDTDLGSIDEEPPESGKESYTVIGSSFICNSCGHNFERPNINHQCQSCEAKFNFKQSRYEKVASYRKTQKAIEMSPRNKLQQVREDMRSLLDEKGLKVEFNATLMGQSEGAHTFDIVGRDKSMLLVADISVNGTPEDLISLFGKKVDVHAREQTPINTLLIDISGNGEVKGLGDVYDIKIMKPDEEFQERLSEYLDDVVKSKG